MQLKTFSFFNAHGVIVYSLQIGDNMIEYDEWMEILKYVPTVPFEEAEIRELIFLVPVDSYAYASQQLEEKANKLLKSIVENIFDNLYKFRVIK